VLKSRSGDALPYLRQLAAQGDADDQERAFDKLETVIVGIAARRGNNWRRAARELERIQGV
jgi:hypothetical protein